MLNASTQLFPAWILVNISVLHSGVLLMVTPKYLKPFTSSKVNLLPFSAVAVKNNSLAYSIYFVFIDLQSDNPIDKINLTEEYT